MQPLLFGLIGKPLSHSFSPGYFAGKFEREGIAGARYEAFELESIGDLPALVQAHPDLRGLNVTIPYKEAVLPLLHGLDADARRIGAVNCIAVSPTGRLTGYNTDWTGFAVTLRPLLGSAAPERALILGSGGAAKAVGYALTSLGIPFQTVSRQGSLRYEQLDAGVLQEATILINTTPLGMYPHVHEAPPIPYQLLGPRHLLYDLIYNPAETFFLKQGKATGARVQNGYDMLIAQAEQSWEIWQRALP